MPVITKIKYELSKINTFIEQNEDFFRKILSELFIIEM